MQIEAISRLISGVSPAHPLTDSGSVWQSWHLDPEFLLPMLLLSGLYLRGLYRWRDRSRHHSRWRTASFLAGIAVLIASQETPIDTLGEHHFSMHMVQHELVMMLGAPLILLGAPMTPVLRGMPREARQYVVRPIARSNVAHRLFRIVTHPLVAGAIFILVIWAWHFAPGWYSAALEHRIPHDLQHFSFFAGAMLFWWNVIDPAPMQARMPYLLRIGYLLAVSTPKHFIAAFIVFSDRALFTAYEGVPQVFNISLIEDQQLGGLIMWIPSQMMHLVAMGIVFAVWAHKSEQEQRRAEADELMARARAAKPPSSEPRAAG